MDIKTEKPNKDLYTIEKFALRYDEYTDNKHSHYSTPIIGIRNDGTRFKTQKRNHTLKQVREWGRVHIKEKLDKINELKKLGKTRRISFKFLQTYELESDFIMNDDLRVNLDNYNRSYTTFQKMRDMVYQTYWRTLRKAKDPLIPAENTFDLRYDLQPYIKNF